MKEVEVVHPWRQHIALVCDVTQDDIRRMLTERERAFAESLPLAQRRREWAAARIAARVAAMRQYGVDEREVHLTTEEARPVALIASERHCVSFSHTGGLGAAAVERIPIGIDIERVRPLVPRTAKFFLSTAESAAAHEVETADALMHFWSAKEAAFKMFSRCTLLSEIALEVRSAEPTSLTLECSFGSMRGTVITTYEEGDHVLAVSRIL